jgi:hypothetical protein
VGQGLFEFGDIDGAGAEVRLQHPVGLAYSDSQIFEQPVVFIADTYNHKIKTLDPVTGEVKKLIGDGEAGSKDGTFLSAQLYQPEGVAFHKDKLYIVDTNNHLIRVADFETGHVRTLTLKNLQQLAPVRPLEVEEEHDRLPAVVFAPGHVSVTFMITLPKGYKFNPGTHISICSACAEGDDPLRFDPSENVTINFDIDEDFDLPLDIVVYYCQEEDERLCLIHSKRVVLPIQIKQGASRKTSLNYLIK